MANDELSSIFLDNQDFICYISDPETYELLYINKPGRDLFGLEKDGYCGKCYEILQGLSAPCEFCTNHLLKPNLVYRWDYYNEKSGKYFTLSDAMAEVNGRIMRLELAYDITASKLREQELNAKLSLEETLVRCIHTLAEEDDMEVAINGLLSIVGNFYAADRAYIFEFDDTRQYMNNTYEWCRSDVQSHKADLQNIPLADVEMWAKRLKRDGAFYIGSLSEDFDPDSMEYQLLAAQKIQNLMVASLEQQGEVIGFLGVDNPRSKINDFRLLRSVLLFVIDDLSKRRMITRLEQMSYVDMLTGVGNRNKYTLALKEIEAKPPEKIGIVYVDINGLKTANDKFGHDYGDHLICSVSEKIKNHFPDAVFRVGGDEFVVLCQGVERAEFECKVAELRGAMQQEEEVSFSIGSNWSDGDVDVIRQIMRADELMYIDKQNYYKTSLVQHYGFQGNTAKSLLNDIRDKKFVVHLQPKIMLASGEITGAEALVRRINGDEIVLPAKFVPTYKTEGVIRHLNFFVLDMVCSVLAQWNREGLFLPVAVNVSRTTLMEYGVAAKMREICEKHGVETRFINIEVTESVGKMDVVVLSALLSEFREYGFFVSLDDFGSEYSNLAILTDMEFDEIKMDKSLIHNICSNRKNRVIVEHAIQICHSLGLTNTVAEGIETAEQKWFLDQCRCKFGQGFLFSKPLPLDEFYTLYSKKSGRSQA